jgi:hypothetical protein
LSIFFWASRSDSTASSEPADASAFLVRVFSSLRTALLRAAALAFVRIRFF